MNNLKSVLWLRWICPRDIIQMLHGEEEGGWTALQLVWAREGSVRWSLVSHRPYCQMFAITGQHITPAPPHCIPETALWFITGHFILLHYCTVALVRNITQCNALSFITLHFILSTDKIAVLYNTMYTVYHSTLHRSVLYNETVCSSLITNRSVIMQHLQTRNF